VCEVVDDPDGFEEVSVVGSAYAPSRSGFILADGACAIYVVASPREATKAREGDEVEAIGRPVEIPAEEERHLERRVAEASPESAAGSAAVAHVRVEAGAPLLDAFALRGEDLAPGER